MSSATLFKVAGGIFLALPIGHTLMYFETMLPGLNQLGHATAAFAAKVSWNQANGYFLTTGLLCLKWAETGIDLKASLDRYIFAVLVATHSTVGLMYLKKGVRQVALAYGILTLLMGVAAAKSK